MAQVEEIRQPAGTEADKGAKIGALAGGGAFLLLGIAASQVTSGDALFVVAPGNVVWITFGGVALGTEIGALIGSLTTRWETIYRR